MSVLELDFKKFIEENEHLLAPPVNNKLIFKSKDYIVMVVGGPNKRTDFHVNQTDEWFYQLKGIAEVNVVDQVTGEFKKIVLSEGKMAMVPGNTPHNPIRHEGSIGLVVERNRSSEMIDQLRWYCSECKTLVHKVEFNCGNIEIDIKDHINAAKENNFKLLICPECGHQNKTYYED
ncbi:3-hydroxyanthranilate 3,4-dioxygenase [Smittium mucronatum]|uniref:3-hydroxyanthranilate 3,4-dioxygenase n=1 Tax=Smittium mucronatum TaxID=133383 RepID=A0A1R0H1G0_9FUNG|nr:3-hydroxyanthranilate 3,4-dioxygenase [Smittium mucronatum]